MTQPAIAAAMGVSLSTVNRAHMAYDQGGIKALKPKPNGGRKFAEPRGDREQNLGYRARGGEQDQSTWKNNRLREPYYLERTRPRERESL
jgi:transposase